VRVKRIFSALALMVALAAGGARAEERMNGMVGLWYHSENHAAFEYDLIAQFFKSKEWMGNYTGPFVMDEISVLTNKFGGGFVAGMRQPEKGSFAVSGAVFTENRWSRFSKFTPGAEAMLSLLLVGFKYGIMDWDWDKWYFAVGFSY
jgi:hypothetical protein